MFFQTFLKPHCSKLTLNRHIWAVYKTHKAISVSVHSVKKEKEVEEEKKKKKKASAGWEKFPYFSFIFFPWEVQEK